MSLLKPQLCCCTDAAVMMPRRLLASLPQLTSGLHVVHWPRKHTRPTASGHRLTTLVSKTTIALDHSPLSASGSAPGSAVRMSPLPAAPNLQAAHSCNCEMAEPQNSEKALQMSNGRSWRRC